MKNKKTLFSTDVIVLVLLVGLVAMAAFFGLLSWKYLLVALAVAVMAAALVLLFIRRVRKSLRALFYGGDTAEEARRSGIASSPLPVAAVQDMNVIWYNRVFLREMLGGLDSGVVPVNRLLPGIDLRQTATPCGQDLAFEDRRYTAYGSHLMADSSVFFITFAENTALKQQAEEYIASRPSVMLIVIDTYDEILKEMRESERALIMSNIDKALEGYIGEAKGFIRRISSSVFLAVVEERHIEKMVARRFDILDRVRAMDEEGQTVTLSIGVGRAGETLSQCEEMAVQALDMALGRGGDQAAVKTTEGFEFYGGVSRSVEKRTKVKSRIIAAAIRDLMAQYDRVLVMGHKNSDMDSVGASVGMLCFCRMLGKPAHFVVDYKNSAAQSLLDMLCAEGYGKDMLSPDEAMQYAGKKTLVVVVDTHVRFLLESAAVYDACGALVLIDHHRRMVGHIDNAVIFYHEPYASSACELVSELLMYVGDAKANKPTVAEANAMLAGIMLDTRTFSLHVGVRTFEAAAYLRRMGAQTESVKRLFSSSMNEYLYRSHLVSEAVVENHCAIVVSDEIPPENEVVAPQAANDLLTIEGVKASFVAIKQGDEIRVSARSMGEVNVQLVMEKLKGGGHLTMAGAQLKGVGIGKAEQMIKRAVAEYFAESANEAKGQK